MVISILPSAVSRPGKTKDNYSTELCNEQDFTNALHDSEKMYTRNTQ